MQNKYRIHVLYLVPTVIITVLAVAAMFNQERRSYNQAMVELLAEAQLRGRTQAYQYAVGHALGASCAAYYVEDLHRARAEDETRISRLNTYNQ